MAYTNPLRIKIVKVYRVAGTSLVSLTQVRAMPGYGEYMLTQNALLVFGRCKNGMEFEVTYTRDADAMHRKFTIEANVPFLRLRDL